MGDFRVNIFIQKPHRVDEASKAKNMMCHTSVTS